MAISPGAPEGARLELDVGVAIATVTLQRPERRNAMTPSLWHGLAAAGDALPPQVRVVVVRGDGPSFSAGIDLRLFTPDGIDGEAAEALHTGLAELGAVPRYIGVRLGTVTPATGEPTATISVVPPAYRALVADYFTADGH